MRRIRLLLLGLVLAATLSRCGGAPPPPPPTVVELTIKAGPDINPDGDSHPSPTTLRVYQLASTDTFEKTDFFPLYDNEAATLGGDLLGRQQITVAPGDNKTITIDVKPQAKAIGIIAAFRNINQAAWRADAPVPANKTTKLTATINAVALKLSGGG